MNGDTKIHSNFENTFPSENSQSKNFDDFEKKDRPPHQNADYNNNSNINNSNHYHLNNQRDHVSAHEPQGSLERTFCEFKILLLSLSLRPFVLFIYLFI